MNIIRNNDIYLIRDTHQYVLKKDPDQLFKSVTTIAGDYFSKFDAIKNSQRIASKYPSRITPKERMAAWDAKTQTGIEIHDEIDKYFRDNIPTERNRSMEGINWLKFHRGGKRSKSEVWSEVIMYSTELSIAGTIDILIKYSETDTYELVDWKTGKLDFKSYQDKKAPHPITSDLMDCNFEQCAIKLSLYRYLLEKYYGFNITNQMVVHLREYDRKHYDTPYYKSHVEAIIDNQRTCLRHHQK